MKLGLAIPPGGIFRLLLIDFGETIGAKVMPKIIRSFARLPHAVAIARVRLKMKEREGSDQKSKYGKLLEEAKTHFNNKFKKLAIDKMKELIVTASRQTDFVAVGASFIICALIEYYSKDYSSACEYLVQLVSSLSQLIAQRR